MVFEKLLSKVRPYKENKLKGELFQDGMSLKDKAIMYGKHGLQLIGDHWDTVPFIYAGYSLGNLDFLSSFYAISAYCGLTVARWTYSRLRRKEPSEDREFHRFWRNMGIGFATVAFTAGSRSNDIFNAASWYLLGGTIGGGTTILSEEMMLKKK